MNAAAIGIPAFAIALTLVIAIGVLLFLLGNATRGRPILSLLRRHHPHPAAGQATPLDLLTSEPTRVVRLDSGPGFERQ
ncbi:MAG: hypothetical protein WCO90_03420 [Planctomycetota bacterium]